MNTILDLLKQAGLVESEVKTYLYLLEQGVSSPPQIAKGAKIARPNLYGTLRSLQDRGLIVEQKQGKRSSYLASDPSVLVHTLEARAEAMKQVLPDLRAMLVAQKNKPSIKFFEGAEQVKEIFYEMLEATSVYGVASTKKLYDALGWDFFKTYIAKMKEKGIVLHDILTEDSSATSAQTPIELLKGLYDVRFLPKDVENLAVDILVWDDKAALISTEAPVFGTLIKNQAIASVLKIMFNLSWKQLS